MLPLNSKAYTNILLIALFSFVYYIKFDAVVVVNARNSNQSKSINKSINQKTIAEIKIFLACGQIHALLILYEY